MCVDEFGISFNAGGKTPTHERDVCNKDMIMNRALVCQALKTIASELHPAKINCLDGNSVCGLIGMLWKKYISDNINVEINGLHSHSKEVIDANLKLNQLEAEVFHEDPCIKLRQKAYDFIYLNCKSSASHYIDSLLCKAKDNAVIAITTSEDPSLYCQSTSLALRHYSGVISKTSYFRELGIRLVIAEIARTAARYGKGIQVLCTASFKVQQSFTIIVKVKKGNKAANDCLSNIKKLLNCSVCEDRCFLPNSDYMLETPSTLLNCKCSKQAKAVNVLGPVWSGSIFCSDFISSMFEKSDECPWGVKIKLLMAHLLEEAQCDSMTNNEPEAKKPKTEDAEPVLEPSFYFNTHRHHPGNQNIKKIALIVRKLQRAGYRASRTHFDPESIRTNASLQEFLNVVANC